MRPPTASTAPSNGNEIGRMPPSEGTTFRFKVPEHSRQGGLRGFDLRADDTTSPVDVPRCEPERLAMRTPVKSANSTRSASVVFRLLRQASTRPCTSSVMSQWSPFCGSFSVSISGISAMSFPSLRLAEEMTKHRGRTLNPRAARPST